MVDRSTAGAHHAVTRREELIEQLIDLILAEGFLHLSIEDLSRRLTCSKSTLYQVAASKEQIITTVVRQVFRQWTDLVEARLDDIEEPGARLRGYLMGISEELSTASPVCFTDINAFAPTREIYHQNTQWAAARVQQLVREAAPMARVDPAFTGAVTGLVFTAIQTGELRAVAGLDDASAYRELAELVTAVAARNDPPSQERTPA